MVNLAVLARVLGSTTKRGRQLFRGKKCTPADKNPCCAYVRTCKYRTAQNPTFLSLTSGPLFDDHSNRACIGFIVSPVAREPQNIGVDIDYQASKLNPHYGCHSRHIGLIMCLPAAASL